MIQKSNGVFKGNIDRVSFIQFNSSPGGRTLPNQCSVLGHCIGSARGAHEYINLRAIANGFPEVGKSQSSKKLLYITRSMHSVRPCYCNVRFSTYNYYVCCVFYIRNEERTWDYFFCAVISLCTAALGQNIRRHIERYDRLLKKKHGHNVFARGDGPGCGPDRSMGKGDNCVVWEEGLRCEMGRLGQGMGRRGAAIGVAAAGQESEE